MTELTAIAYTSTAVRPLGARDLDDLLIHARAFNERVQVTGALLHHQGTFFQYLEGPRTAVTEVYARIRRSGLHEHLRELLNQAVETRQFAHWHMAFTEAPLTMLEEIANEHWAMTLPSLREQQARSPGLQLLLNFWDSVNCGDPSG